MKEKIERVTFDVTPKVRMRVISENDSKELVKEKKKFPFKLDNHVIVTVFTSLRKFSFRIKASYIWNGADIPKTLFIFGQSKDNHYLIASMIHDFLLEKKDFIYKEVLKECIEICEYRRLTSLIFREILKMHKTNVIKANCMAWAVDFFQTTVNKRAWKI